MARYCSSCRRTVKLLGTHDPGCSHRVDAEAGGGGD